MSEVLVTGSKGFIGKHLVKMLGKSNVIEYDIKTDNDILDPDQLEYYFINYDIHFVVHLAAISNRQDTDKNPALAIRTNIEGTYNVLSVAKKYHVPVIVASSAATARPDLSLYGTTKTAVEHIAKLFSNAIVVRFYNVYGPGSKSVVNKFIDQIKKGKEITVYGNTRRDYVWVEDVIGVLMNIIAGPAPTGTISEIGTKVGTTLKELYKMIQKTTSKNITVNQQEPLPEIQESVLGEQDDADMIYIGETSLKEGIKRLI